MRCAVVRRVLRLGRDPDNLASRTMGHGIRMGVSLLTTFSKRTIETSELAASSETRAHATAKRVGGP